MTPEEIVEFAEALARVAAGGGGAKALAAHLAEHLGTGVWIDDADGRHVASAGNAERNGATGVPILAGNVRLGTVHLAGAKPGTEHALRLAAAAIAVELARDSGAGRGRRRTFWERLLSGTYHDAAAARDDASALGVTPAPSYLVIALEPEPLDDASAPPDPAELRAIAAEAFRGSGADVGLLERASSLLVFIPVAREIDASNARTAAGLLPKNLLKRKPPLRLSAGVGPVEPIISVGRGAELAGGALVIGRRIRGAGHVAIYDELGAYPLLFEGTNVDRMREFAGHVLAPLRAYDEKHATELERTLKLYLEVGENVKVASTRLSVHRHTVFYRLRQISDICKVSLESPSDQLTLRLAVAIDALHAQ